MKVIEVPASFDLRDIRPVERPELPDPGPGQVLIRMNAVSLNFRDLLVAQGHDRWLPPTGRIPVSDGVGVVLAVGSGANGISVGQRVITTILPKWISGPLTVQKREGGLGGPAADGVLAERILLDATAVVPAPDYLTDVEAATLPCAALTAWRYGNFAHLWSSYTLQSDGKQVARGINSIQAIKEAGGWRVTGIMVQAESATAPLPKEYLP